MIGGIAGKGKDMARLGVEVRTSLQDSEQSESDDDMTEQLRNAQEAAQEALAGLQLHIENKKALKVAKEKEKQEAAEQARLLAAATDAASVPASPADSPSDLEAEIAAVMLVRIPVVGDIHAEPTTHGSVIFKVPNARVAGALVEAEVDRCNCAFAILMVGTKCSAYDTRDDK